jgi:hypothetical protein
MGDSPFGLQGTTLKIETIRSEWFHSVRIRNKSVDFSFDHILQSQL